MRKKTIPPIDKKYEKSTIYKIIFHLLNALISWLVRLVSPRSVLAAVPDLGWIPLDQQAWHLIINISNKKIIGCSPHLLPWSFTLLALPCAHQRAQHPSPTNLDFLHWSCCCLSIPIWFWSCLGLLLCKSSRLFLKIFSSYLSSPAPPCTWSAPLNPSTSHQKSSPTLESIVKNQFWDFSEIFRDS